MQPSSPERFCEVGVACHISRSPLALGVMTVIDELCFYMFIISTLHLSTWLMMTRIQHVLLSRVPTDFWFESRRVRVWVWHPSWLGGHARPTFRQPMQNLSWWLWVFRSLAKNTSIRADCRTDTYFFRLWFRTQQKFNMAAEHRSCYHPQSGEMIHCSAC